MTDGIVAGGGMVVEWFELFGGYTDPAIVPEMERDRLEYAERPGFIRKLLVVGDNPAGGDLAGGVYFLKDPGLADDFLHWASDVHRDPDGQLFEDRGYVGKSHAYVCEVLGHVGSVYSHQHPTGVRIQRLDAAGLGKAAVSAWWSSATPAMGATGLLGVTLAYHKASSCAFLISVSGLRRSCSELCRDSLEQLAGTDIAASLVEEGALRTDDDISLWVHTVWEGYQPDEVAPAAAWPNSPPLPCADYWPGHHR